MSAARVPAGREMAARFLDEMFRQAEGYVWLATLDAASGRWSERPIAWPERREEVIEAALELRGAAEVYFCTSLRTKARRRVQSAPAVLDRLHADLDRRPPDEALLERLDPALVASGSVTEDGWTKKHAYLRLRDPVDEITFKRLAKLLQRALDGDAKIDSKDVLRIPGTFNHKAARAGSGRPAKVLFQTWGGWAAGWDAADLERVLVEAVGAQPAPERESAQIDKSATIEEAEAAEWLSGLGRVPCRAVSLVLRAERAKFAAMDSRHDAAVEGVMALVRLGAEGHHGIAKALGVLREDFFGAFTVEETDVHRGGRDVEAEWKRLVLGAVAAVAGSARRAHARGACPGADGLVPAQDGGLAEFTDASLTDRLAGELFDGRFCWVRGLGWLGWDGRRWAGVGEEGVTEAVRTYLRIWLSEQAQEGVDPDRLKKLMALQSRARISALVSLSRGRTLREAVEFDAHPDLLNVRNGVLDLRTGLLGEHDAALLLTKLAGCDYVEGASHPDWTRALRALPEDTRGYLIERLGQALTGHIPPDDKLVLLRGGGENGKSTVMAGITAAFGEYAGLIPRSLLMADAHAHPTDLMTLHGLRLAFVEELPEARKLNVARLKETVGTSHITARLLYKDFITFRASHAIFVNTNYLPVVTESDHGTWRRLERVEFPYTYSTQPKDEQRLADTRLRHRVESTVKVHQAALSMLVAAAARWYVAGREMPEVPAQVAVDTQEWRESDDVVAGYTGERLHVGPGAHVMSSDLLADLNEWLRARGMQEWSARLMASRFAGHDSLHGVEHAVVRPGDKRIGGLSRPFDMQDDAVPVQYRAWLRIAFQAP